MSREHLLFIALFIGIAGYSFDAFGNSSHPENPFSPDIILTSPQDTIPLEERFGDFLTNPAGNPFDLQDPAIIEQNVEYDPVSGQYIITEKIGENYFRPPSYMTFAEYLDYRTKQQQRTYFKELSGVSSGDRSSSGRIDPIAKVDVKSSLVDRLFGGTTVDIRPQGNIDLTFGWEFSNTQNPGFTQRQQRQGGFDFDMQIQMNVQGTIGDKLKLQTNYNTQATFDFDNTMKLDYSTDAFSDDDIIKKIEAGNVSLPLRGTLIQGSQSLFGIKTELQFGRLRLTAVASQQKSEREEITLQGGSQFQTFEVRADEYDENRHFFLTHYNRDHFEEALKELPQVKSLFKIQKIQVWITDTRNATENIRDIVAIADLGEPRRLTNSTPEFQPPAFPRYRDLEGDGLPDNFANPIYNELVSDPRTKFVDKAVNVLKTPPFSFQQPRDFEKVSARMLSFTEFNYHPNLGFVSLNINVQPDQVVGVAFEYAYKDTVYQVGQLAEDVSQSADTINQNVLFVKMLKSTTQRVDLPTWDLMMKNVYSIGAFQVAEDEFKLDIFYDDPGQGKKRFLPESNIAGKPLLQVFNLDNLNTQRDPQPDGVFDFVSGLTINTRNGRIMFPKLEPFGSALAQQFTDPADSAKFVYTQLYNSTITTAREFAEFNRFTIEGSYKSSVSADISLGAFNIPEGSVRVSAGGQTLIEGRDYEVDYNIGRLKILNDAVLSSGQPIRVSFEDNTLFGFQTKTMLGLRADYEVNKNLIVGATLLKLFERPYTQKVNIGDDPINNTIYGLDVNYSAEAPWLTKLVDKIPLINTKQPSSITFSAEAAALRPGHSKAINESGDDESEGGGVIYIDDFEGSVSSLDMKTPFIGNNGWVIASVPQNDAQNNNPLFPESKFIDTTLSGVNRAMLNWYRLDPSFRDGTGNNPYTLIIQQQEVFRNFTPTNLLSSFIPILDLRYLPDERGPYNFDLPEGTPFSSGIDSQGKLRDPETRWGGIMRSLNTNDFEAANIEFIEFWVMSPYLSEDGSGAGNPIASTGSMDGELVFELGNISEDVMLDSRKFFENGLPGPNLTGRRTVETGWGNVPLSLQITNAFDIDPENRLAQDVGLDGLNDEGEREKFGPWLSALQSGITPVVFDSIFQDPSNDNFIHFRDERFNDVDVFTRYSRFFGTEGNSPPQTGSLTTSSTTLPDSEDLDRDRTLNETESYFQYRVPIRFDGDRGIDIEAASQFITDTIQSTNNRRVWYRFRIPLDQIDGTENFKRVGGIQDFRSIRFMRMYFKGFERTINFRFATLELVRNQWRRYRQSLGDRCVSFEPDDIASNGNFDVNAVNIEENSTRSPFGYILPPGIVREQALGVNLQALQNEQALSMGVCDLEDGDAKGIYKIVNMDMRVFKQMRMFVHAEPRDCGMGAEEIEDGKLTVFIRLGSDFKNNYYEYELPLTISRDESLAYNDRDYPREVWRRANDFEINFETLKELKLLRNNSPNVSIGDVFPEGGFADPDTSKQGAKLRIRGNPNLGLVKSIMIGIRNPKEGETCDPNDEQSVEIWVNELRVFGLDERGGVAATAKLDLQLADFGTVSLSTRVSSIGWGALDQQLAQRSREENINYDIATSIELGKFLPQNSGLRIPFYFQWSKEISNPQYDPYDLDIELKDKLRSADPTIRDSLREQAQTVTTIKSVSFTNVRKERTRPNKKPMPWDVANFSLTYGFDQTASHDPIIEEDKITRHRGALDYQYSRRVKYIEPFKKTFKNDKFLKLISNINFNPLPNSFSFSTQLDRRFNTTKYRFAGDNPLFNTFYNKQFLWERNYDLQWDLSRNLKFRFFADNRAVIDEPDETQMLKRHALDPGNPLYIDNIKSYRRDSIKGNILRGGRTKAYNHRMSLSYTLPFKQIPFFDWVNVRASYEGSYWWEAASLSPGANSLGNIIRNQQTREVRADFDFEKIYNYSKFLKQINSRPRPNRNRGRGSAGKGKKSTEDGKDKGGEDKDKKKDKKDKKKDNGPSKAARAMIRPFLFVRKLNVTFNEDFQTVIPGYLPGSGILGLNDFSSPGWGFIAGFQPNIEPDDYFTSKDWLYKNWDLISGDLLLNRDVEQRYTQRFSAKLKLEPIRDFKIDIEVNRSKTDDHTERFARDTIFIPGQRFQEEFDHFVPRDFGSYKISFTSIKTFFNNDIIGLFDEFEANRVIIANRLSNAGPGTHDNPDDAAALFPEGYGRFQQNVLVPAFLAAYTGKDASTVEIDQDYTRNVLLKTLPKPNWRITYTGLSKLPMFKEIFRSINITHGYSGSLTVNRFESDLQFDRNQPAKKDPIKLDFFSRFEIPNIVIQEQFNPLIGVNLRMQNGMDLRMDFKKARDLRMSFQDFSLNETKSEDLTVGFGYKLKNVQLDFLSNKKKKGRAKGQDNPPPDNNRRPGRQRGGGQGEAGDLDISFDLSIRDDITIRHELDRDQQEPTRGNRTVSILPAAEFRVNRQLSLRFFFDYRRTVPKTSQGFPRTDISSGITVRFSLN